MVDRQLPRAWTSVSGVSARRGVAAAGSQSIQTWPWIAGLRLTAARRSPCSLSSVGQIRSSSIRPPCVLALLGSQPPSTSRELSINHLAGDGLEHGLGDVEVGVDLLDVVQILEAVDEAQELAGAVLAQRHGASRHEPQLGGLDREALGFDRIADRRQVARRSRDLP